MKRRRKNDVIDDSFGFKDVLDIVCFCGNLLHMFGEFCLMMLSLAGMMLHLAAVVLLFVAIVTCSPVLFFVFLVVGMCATGFNIKLPGE